MLIARYSYKALKTVLAILLKNFQKEKDRLGRNRKTLITSFSTIM